MKPAVKLKYPPLEKSLKTQVCIAGYTKISLDYIYRVIEDELTVITKLSSSSLSYSNGTIVDGANPFKAASVNVFSHKIGGLPFFVRL